MSGRRARRGDPKLAVAYLRVSTDEQHLGPEAQRAAIEAWAAREGVQVTSWHVDKGVSGGSALADRPALLEALSDLRERRAGWLAIAKRDRLARSVEITLAIERAVEKQGAQIASADGVSAAQGIEGRILRGISDLFAEIERAMIQARTKAALAAKKGRGELPGRAAFGFRGVGEQGETKRLEPAAGELAAVRLIFELRQQGKSEREIVRELTARHVVGRTGAPLGQTQVHRILARGLPKGETVDEQEYLRRRRIRCSIEPTSEVVNVDLYEVIVEHQRGYVSRSDVEPIIDWIKAGDVALTVIDLARTLPQGWESVADELKGKIGDGGEEHKRLIVLAMLFLENQRIECWASGNSFCAYAGGWADVKAKDGSIVIECGNLRHNKVSQALLNLETIMVVPFDVRDLGYKFTPDRERMQKHVDAFHKSLVAKAAGRGLLSLPTTSTATEINATEMSEEAIEHPETGQKLTKVKRK